MSIHSTGLGDLRGAMVVSPRGEKQLLQCGHKHVYQLIARGEIVSFKDGRSRKITVASIEAYIARCLTIAAGSKLKCPA
jgi:excisionase family DNA binding protein